MKQNGEKSLKGRTLYIHPMTQAGARLLAAVFRSTGIDAHITPPSDARTLELGSMYSGGDECLPQKITLGDYLKISEMEGFDSSKAAFIMPTAQGPCRFGQYWPALEAVFKKRGLEDVLIFNPSSENGYEGVGGRGMTFYRTAWLSILTADIMRKMLLKTRPYEKVKGTTDDVYEKGLLKLEEILEQPDLSYQKRLKLVHKYLSEFRDEFRAVDADYTVGKPLIAVVGEIFCRHNRFANGNILRKLEEHGAETWIADVSEWVMYTDWSRKSKLRRHGKRFSKEMVLINLKQHIMLKDEHRLLAPFHDDFIGYEEPSNTEEIVSRGKPYLPAEGALGEMALSIGRSVFSYFKGVDGVADISPFSCMNGIVSEAIYPSISKDHNGIPCRVFYFDGINSDLDRDIGIYMELVKGYMSRKKEERKYPAFFKDLVEN